MWNTQRNGDGIGGRQGISPGTDNENSLHPDPRAVSGLAAFQQGTPVGATSYAYPPSAHYALPAATGYPVTTTSPQFFVAAPHPNVPLYYHPQVPYGAPTDDPSNLARLHAAHRHSLGGLSTDRYNDENVDQSHYNDGIPQNDQKDEGSDEEDDNSQDVDEQEESVESEDEEELIPETQPEAMMQSVSATQVEAQPEDSDSDELIEEAISGDGSDSDEDGDEIVHPPIVVESVPVKEKVKIKIKKSVPSELIPPKKSLKKNSISSDAKKSVSKPKTTEKLPMMKETNIDPPDPYLDCSELLLHERPSRITEAEYKNLETLMTQFCRVPLLGEFSRPVGLLHPEIKVAYTKIIKHPVDIGHICRGIRLRMYKNARDVRLEMWRVFANCVIYNSHPNNKEASPYFVSMALHLKDFFNHLWQEYMLPSDYRRPSNLGSKSDIYVTRLQAAKEEAFKKRDNDRRRRLANSGVLHLSNNFTEKNAKLLTAFIKSGGCVDDLDTEPVFGRKKDERDMQTIVSNLQNYSTRLKELSAMPDLEYTLDNLYQDLKQCYADESFLEDSPALKYRLRNRVERFFWKQAAPLHEANARGVNQSSIWGNMAAAIWARESSKKAYWPALCLGILPPAEKHEGWHDAVTERNESRLPEKLRAPLMLSKQRCEAAQKRQSLSYFLVEFLGTHEFIWVKETDIIENFDRSSDPNQNAKLSTKKSRSTRHSASSVTGSKSYQKALAECEWASQEYESVVQDSFEFSENASDGENYSYAVLAQSDDEADADDDLKYEYDEEVMSVSDIDEVNWLLSHSGMIDSTPAGRKNAKLRTQAMRKNASIKEKNDGNTMKKKSSSESKEKKDNRNSRESSGNKSSKDSSMENSFKKEKGKVVDVRIQEREDKREQRDLEKKRKKRLRDRERVLKNEERKFKRRRSGPSDDFEDDNRGLARDKKARANAIVKAYLTRLAQNEDSRSLALSGVMSMPAAMVDSTGLLGMALAFRAVTGELSMPDDGEEQIAKRKPWLAIDTDTPASSLKRTENLEKKISLLQAEIARIRSETQERNKLTEHYIHSYKEEVLEREADDIAARQNHYKTRKKPTSKVSLGADELSEKVEIQNDEVLPNNDSEIDGSGEEE